MSIPLCNTSLSPLLCSPFLSQPESRLTHGGDGPAVGHKTTAVLEDSTTIEEWDGDSYSLLKSVLEPAHPGARGVLNLLEYVILPKGEDRYQSCPMHQGKPDEALAVPQHQLVASTPGIQCLLDAPNNDGQQVATSFPAQNVRNTLLVCSNHP